MDSSYMATAAMDSPVDAVMKALRHQVSTEVKADISSEVMERVLRIVGNALANMNVTATVNGPPPVVQVTVPPSAVTVNSSPPLVDITNEMDMDDMCECLKRIEDLLSQLLSVLRAPVRRTIQRDSENLIASVTEGRM